MRGRPRTPTALKILRGTEGKHRRKGEPTPDSEIPSCPAHLDETAREEWNRLGPLLMLRRVLTAWDRAALAGYCANWSRWIAAEKKIKEDGEVLKSDEGGYYQNPWLSVSNKCQMQMHKFAIEFGLTPASRSRVNAEKQSGEKSGKARFFAS